MSQSTPVSQHAPPAITRVVVDFRAWQQAAPWMTRRAWGVSFLERLCRLLGQRRDVRVVGLCDGPLPPPIARAAEGMEFRSGAGTAPVTRPRLEGTTLLLPGNAVFSRAWLRAALAGTLCADGFLLVGDADGWRRGRALVLADSYKTAREGLARMHRWLAWYVGQPFFLLRVPPNVTSMLSLALNLVGGWMVLRGSFVAGASVFVFSCLLDSVDGMTARLHVRESPAGSKIDAYLDYVYYVIILFTTAFGAHRASGSFWPLAYLGAALVGAVAAIGTLEFYQRVYGFSTGQAFNRRVNEGIQGDPQLRTLAGLLHLFKRHTLPYLYLAAMLAGRPDLIVAAFGLGVLVPPAATYLFYRLAQRGVLRRAR